MTALSRRTLLVCALATPALATLARATPACAQCRLGPAAIIPLRAIDGFPVIAATIRGTPVSFLLDTGAQAHLLLPEAVDALRLTVLPGSVPMVGTGGARDVPIVMLDDVRLGPVRLDRALTPVSALPLIPSVSPPVAGLIGAPLLDRFDLDLDVPAGQLGLYAAGACEGPAFAPPTTTVALTILADRQALLPVEIDGVEIMALLDTGSRATLLTEDAARRLGLRAPASANTARGVDGTVLPVGHVRVRSMRVGDDLRHDVPLSIAPVQLGRADLLLGLDFLRLRRVWISYVTARLVLALPNPVPSAR